MSKIVVFVGLLGSGKSFQSQQYLDNGYISISFADKIREYGYKILNNTPENYDNFKNNLLFLEKHNFLSNIFKKIFPLWITGRQYLQYIGDTFKIDNKDFWTNIAIKHIDKTIKDGKNIVISDARYKAELKALQQYSAKNNIELKIYFTDYRSGRYNNNDKHNSELLSFWLRDELKLNDMEEVTVDNGFYYIKDGKRYKTAIEIYRNDQIEDRDLLKDENLNIFEKIMLKYKGE